MAVTSDDPWAVPRTWEPGVERHRADIASASPQRDITAWGGAPVPLERTPGYQFRVEEGEKVIRRNASARGMGHSGATLKALQAHGQGVAAQEYDAARRRAIEDYDINRSEWLDERNRNLADLDRARGYGMQDDALSRQRGMEDYQTARQEFWDQLSLEDRARMQTFENQSFSDQRNQQYYGYLNQLAQMGQQSLAMSLANAYNSLGQMTNAGQYGAESLANSRIGSANAYAANAQGGWWTAIGPLLENILPIFFPGYTGSEGEGGTETEGDA